MPVNFGYACLNMTLGPRGGFKDMIKNTWLKFGLKKASELGLENSQRLIGIIDWNNKNGIKLYRMTSNLFPWSSEYKLTDLPDWRDIQSNLEMASRLAQRGGQRLTFHPGQFNCLASPRQSVVENCVRDLANHGDIMDIMGLPRTRESKINIHLGGVFGDKVSAIDRWCKNFDLLPDSVKTRITLENDDKANCYSVKDLHLVWQRLGVPIVFDFHHHGFCTGELSEKEALILALSTWNGIRPVTHYSESASLREGKETTLTAHSAFVTGPVNDYGLDFDCVVEAKAKELAVLQLITGKNYENR